MLGDGWLLAAVPWSDGDLFLVFPPPPLANSSSRGAERNLSLSLALAVAAATPFVRAGCAGGRRELDLISDLLILAACSSLPILRLRTAKRRKGMTYMKMRYMVLM